MLRRLIRAVHRCQTEIVAAAGHLQLRYQGVPHGPGLLLLGRPIVNRAAGSRITIGSGVTLCSSSRHAGLGVDHPVILRTMRPGAEIQIGDRCGISGGTILAVRHIEIGADCLLGANVTVVDSDFHPLDARRRHDPPESDAIAVAPVRIESNVFIGTNAIVLKGVTIGSNSVIGAGSVVTTDIPANVIAAGNPCRVIRPLNAKNREAPGRRVR
jgi:acetyltransferase-like isoleucine patch superfamily enzyme